MPKRKVDDYSRHEALDRTYACMTMVETLLLDHRGVATFPKAKRKIKRAFQELFDAHQTIGNEHLGDIGRRKGKS